MTALRLGLDVGTTSIKAAAFHPDGNRIALAERASSTLTEAGGRSEQDMDAVWATVCAVLGDLTDRLTEYTYASLGICAQGDGLWAIDAAGRPVAAAPLWSDTRAAQDVTALAASGVSDAVGRACHTSLWPGTSGTLWRWMKREAPQTANACAAVFTCGDWIGWNLTGERATDFSNASIPFLDLQTRSYSPEALSALECDDLAPRLQTPRRADSLLGRVSAEAAAATGLSEGLPVAVPTLDLSAMIVGMGLDQPGQTMMIMGTTAVVNILTDAVVPCGQPVGASALHPTSDAIIRIMAPTSGAAAFDWFAGLHPQSLGGETPAKIAAKLNELVTEVPPGANGVTFLPYLNGERAPFVAPSITASFTGLTAASTKADMGRAMMEGAAMSLRHCLALEGNRPDQPVQLTGGGSKNRVWCQIIADIVGAPIIVSTASDQGLWGAAALGAAAAGQGTAMSLAEREVTSTRYVPDPGSHAAYDRVFARYCTLSDAARSVAHTLDTKGILR